MSTYRGFSTLLSLLAIALVLGGGYYLYTHRTQEPSVEPVWLAFISPIEGQTVDPNEGVVIEWTYSGHELDKFPPDATWIRFYLAKENGDDTYWTVGEERITKTLLKWNTKAVFNQNLNHGLNLEPPYRYRVKATIVYQPKDSLGCDPEIKGECQPIYSDADQNLIREASAYNALSPVFTIDMSKYVPQVVTVDENSTTITADNPSVTGTSNMDAVMFQLLLPHSTPSVTVPVVDGRWTFTPASDIPNGTYGVNIWDKTGFNTFDSPDITISR